MRLLPRHPGNLLLAIVLASLVWYINALDRRERISERQLDAAFSLVNVPSDMVVTSEVPRFLSLRVRGPLNRLRTLNPNQTGVVIDLRGAAEGLHDLPVEARNVVVPAGTQVLAVSPSQLSFRLERFSRRRVPIKPRTTGEPAGGLVIGRVLAEPSSALVSGPRLQIEALPAVTTDPVTVDGAEGAVEAMVAVRSPQPLMRIVEPAMVRVIVEVVPGRPPGTGGRKR